MWTKMWTRQMTSDKKTRSNGKGNQLLGVFFHFFQLLGPLLMLFLNFCSVEILDFTD